jgi:hypothetical protein
MADLNLLMKPYLSALEQLGCPVVETSGSRLLVELLDLLVYVSLDSDDTAFVRVWLPVPLEGAGATAAQAAATDALERTKCLKVAVDAEHDVATFSVDLLVSGPALLPSAAHLAVVLPRVQSMLLAGIRRFKESVVLSGIASATDVA